jgi:D-alanyl-D-alanine carboxypeptidase/D-alanyl-D-alanine-endopeptidase (penicillin-binding protein 4)
VTADVLVRVLTAVYHDERLCPPFLASLPVAGMDGTLAERLKGTAAENNVRAKTGTFSQVRSLAGYVRTADGEPLAFAIVANNFGVPAALIDRTTDAIVASLAEFRR